jgi:hypothetical protein
MVNHPNAPIMPNCLSTMLNYTDTLLQSGAARESPSMLAYVPNSYARTPTWQSTFFDPDVIMHGLCLLAHRDVGNEELLYDYRLQSDKLPNWYSIVEYGDGFEDEQVVFFQDNKSK